MRLKYWGCLALAGALVLFSVTAIAGDYTQGFEAGRVAAKADHSGLAQFAGGMFLGIFYLGYALIAPVPGAPTWRLQDISAKSDEYQRGFMDGYDKMWRSTRSRNAFGGLITGVAALYVVYAAALASYY